MGDKKGMKWQKILEGWATILERPLDSKTRPFIGMVGVTGEPKGLEATCGVDYLL